jgi:hypothetical protein
MIVELALGFVFAFMVIAFGSYAGAKIALRSYFGKEFTDSEAGKFTLSKSDYNESTDGNE